MPHTSKSKSGFTLVELAITLVVVGMLIGLGMGMIGPIINMTKLRETREILSGTSESINGWAIKNNRLPQFSNFTSVISHRKDSWGNPLTYLYDANLAPGYDPLDPLKDYKDTICGRGFTTISLEDSITKSTYPDIAYIILSQGDNAAIDTKSGSIAVASGAVTGVITANTANDIVKWVTLSELRSKVGCIGAPLKIVNSEQIFATSQKVTIIADGGVPFATGGKYQWCVKSLNRPQGKQPDAYNLLDSLNPTLGCGLNQTSCSSLGTDETPSNWLQADDLTLGNLPVGQSYLLKLLVRDNNGNCADRKFNINIL